MKSIRVANLLDRLSRCFAAYGAQMKPMPLPEKPKPESVFQLKRDPEPAKTDRNFLNDSYAKRFAHLVAAIKPPFSIGLEGEWGRGKTFFLTAVTAQPVVASRCEVVEFDAWSAPSDGPLLPGLLSKIGVELNIPRDQWFESVVSGGEAVSGLAAIPGVVDPMMSIGALASRAGLKFLSGRWRKGAQERREQLIQELPTRFDALVAAALKVKKKDTLLVFVDNLDRCLPTAALDLIERMRQLFKSNHCIVVVAYDLAIINDAIKARYGVESIVSGRGYLEKLIDLPIQLPPAEPKDFVDLLSAHYARYTEREDAAGAMTRALASMSKMGALFRVEFLANPRKWFRIVRQLAVSMHLSGAETLHELLPNIMLLLATREYHPELYRAIKKRPEIVHAIVTIRIGEWKTGTEKHGAPGGNRAEREEWFKAYGPLSLMADDTAFEICHALGEFMTLNPDGFTRVAAARFRDGNANLIKQLEGMGI